VGGSPAAPASAWPRARTAPAEAAAEGSGLPLFCRGGETWTPDSNEGRPETTVTVLGEVETESEILGTSLGWARWGNIQIKVHDVPPCFLRG